MNSKSTPAGVTRRDLFHQALLASLGWFALATTAVAQEPPSRADSAFVPENDYPFFDCAPPAAEQE